MYKHALYMCMCVYIYIYIYVFLYLYVSGMNDLNDTRNERKKLGLFCYWKVLTLPVKCRSVIRKCTWTSCKCTL